MLTSVSFTRLWTLDTVGCWIPGLGAVSRDSEPGFIRSIRVSLSGYFYFLMFLFIFSVLFSP
ncbi:uncharacterized protein BDW47DRAFT_114371 [Aspergillus candidus]|uniref:Uncharacterized protein n=1 Tax=Aspergillus candidus TaxID=41067 RepID=A0A2I2EXW1_ASPCN|nr:hypothetical protein BDW47DRAFT_114371 [Aspergillus candidus]PLB33210.1 hypothetical protein BDW47DRAFT_114371 [Aspergillus candidus]